jgi:DNA-binding NtrC family response regulator
MSANLQQPARHIVLVAIPDEWRTQVQQILEQNGYSVVMATSKDEARIILSESQLNGAVIVSDWAMTHEGSGASLIQLTKGRIPTVWMIQKSTPRQWFEELYQPPLHEFCTVPFAADELLVRLNTVILKAETDAQT